MDSPQNKSIDSPQGVSFHDILEASPDTTQIDGDHLSKQSSLLTQKAMFLLGLAEKYKQQDYKLDQIETSDVVDELLDPTLLEGLSDESKEKTELLTQQLEKDARKCLNYALSLRTHINQATTPSSVDGSSISNATPSAGDDENKDIQDLMVKINQFTKKVSSKYDRFGSQLVVKGKSMLEDTIKSQEADTFIKTGKRVIDHWIERRQQGKAKADNLPSDDGPNGVDGHFESLLAAKGDDVITFLSDLRCNAVSLLNTVHKHKQTLVRAARELEAIIGDDEDIRKLIEKGKHKLADNEENRQDLSHTDEALQKLSTKGERLLDKLHSSQFGQNLLQKGSNYLAQLDEEDKLNPDTLYLKAKRLQEDPDYRQQLITRIKDGLLSFLLEYLPQMEIEPLEHDDENSTYSIRNISLKEFIIRSDDIDITLIPHGVLITAKNLLFKMSDVEWNYASKSFPYPYGSGKIDGIANDVRLTLKLRVEVEEFEHGTSTQHNQTPTITDISVSAASTSPESPTPPSPQSSHEKTVQSVESSPPSHDVTLSSPKSPTQQDKSKTWTVVNALNTAFHHRYKLILYPEGTKPYLQLVSLSLTIKDTWFGQLATFLLTLFNKPVKHYIQKAINDLIARKSSVLLAKINRLISDFLPVLAKVSDKVQDKSDEVEDVIRTAARQIKKDVLAERQTHQSANGNIQLNLPPYEALLSKSPNAKQTVHPSGEDEVKQHPGEDS